MVFRSRAGRVFHAGAPSTKDIGSNGFKYHRVSSRGPLGNEQSFRFASGFRNDLVAKLRVYAVLRADWNKVAPGDPERTKGCDKVRFHRTVI